jgi:MFS transporter, DHA2 family, triacylglyceride efflux pump
MQRHDLERNTALLAMLAACSAVFLTALDQTVVVTALPKMITDLQISSEQLDRAAWIVSGYLLGYVIAMPFMGRVSDMFGRRRIFIICLGIFGFGSLLCGLAPILGQQIDISFLQRIGINVAAPGDFSDPTALNPSLVWLVAARFVQAAGGGAMIPVAMAIAGDFYGEKQRALALGLIGMVTEAGGVLGPLYGAIIVQVWGWQAIFFLNLPIVAILAFFIWRLIPLPVTTAGAEYRRGRIDFLGAILLGAALICLSVGLSQEAANTAIATSQSRSNQAPIQNNPWLIGASLILIAAFIALEVYRERRWTSARSEETNSQSGSRKRHVLPMVELSLFTRWPFSASALVSFLVGAALIIAMVNIPLFIATVLGGQPIDSGLALLRLTAMIPLGAISGGWLCARISCRLTAILGLIFTATGFWLMHLWSIQVNWLEITSSAVVGGFGFGLVIAPIATTAINVVSNRQMGMGSSVVTVLRMVGMILGLALLTSWGLGYFHNLLVAFKPPAGVIPFSDPYNKALAQYAVFAAHEVYTSIFLAAGFICLVAIIPSFLLEGRKPSLYAVRTSRYSRN